MALSLYPSLLPVCLKGRLFFDAVAQGVYVCLCGERFFFSGDQTRLHDLLIKEKWKENSMRTLSFFLLLLRCVWHAVFLMACECRRTFVSCFFFSFFFSTLADSCIFFFYVFHWSFCPFTPMREPCCDQFISRQTFELHIYLC